MAAIKRKAIKFIFLAVIFAVGAAALGAIIPSNPWIIPVGIALIALFIWRKLPKKRKRSRSRVAPKTSRIQDDVNGESGANGGSLESRK